MFFPLVFEWFLTFCSTNYLHITLKSNAVRTLQRKPLVFWWDIDYSDLKNLNLLHGTRWLFLKSLLLCIKQVFFFFPSVVRSYNFFPQNVSGGGDQMPTVTEVCESFGLNDVDLEYTDNDYQTLTTYKLFQQHVRPLLAKENPRVRQSNVSSWECFQLNLITFCVRWC